MRRRRRRRRETAADTAPSCTARRYEERVTGSPALEHANLNGTTEATSKLLNLVKAGL